VNKWGRNIGVLTSAVVISIVGYQFLQTNPLIQDEEIISFNQHIRPILNKNCTGCHGGVRQQGNVSFIYREQALSSGKSGLPTIIPGDPENSELMKRITHANSDDRMPFDRPPLSTEQVSLLSKWIEQGAEWEDHWSFIPVKEQQVPELSSPVNIKSPIDNYIQVRLEQEGMSPKGEATKAELIRRVSLDLTGLPPTLEEIEAFQADDSDIAYEKVVDGLLASPHYGERWASLWMDLSRYADTKGFEKDPERTVWPFRDWVIDAFNNNMSYDDFVINQLAGDLLPDQDYSKYVPTTFHRLAPTNDEGGTDDEEFRMLAVMDRSVTSWGVLNGLTMQCVQCHAHPYDPIRHDEYYKSLAFFNTSVDGDWSENDYPHLYVAKDSAQEKLAYDLQAEIDILKQNLTGSGKDIEAASNWNALLINKAQYDPIAGMEWRIKRVNDKRERDANPNNDQLVKPLEKAKAAPEPMIPMELKEGDAFAIEGNIPNVAFINVIAPIEQTTLTALKIAIPPMDAEMARHTPEEGFIMERADAWVISPDGQRQKIEFAYFAPDSEENLNFIHSKPTWIRETLAGNNEFHFENEDLYALTGSFAAKTKHFHKRWTVGIPKKPIQLSEGSSIEVRLATGEYYDQGLMPAPVRRVSLEASSDDSWTDFAANAERQETLNQIVVKETQLAKIPAHEIPVMHSQDQSIARETRLFERGNYLAKVGDALIPGTPKIFPAMIANQAPDRLGFAKWFFGPEQPLTARVAVNRYWEQLFGKGIVETLEDFGTVGNKPTHPELLDWLAWKFQHELNWDMKALLKEIVLSSTYRQSAVATPEDLEKDPFNVLIARGPQQRLTAEMVRDQALLVSGLLSRKMGGAPVMPPQPEGVDQTVYSDFMWVDEKGEDRYRRAIYTFLKRTTMYPSFVTFDVAQRDISHARRMPTNTPLQALVTLNDPVYLEAAEALARHVVSEDETLEGQIALAAVKILSRPISDVAVKELAALYNDALNMIEGDEKDIAALTIVTSTLLNMDAALVR
jgi:hypothetical protein